MQFREVTGDGAQLPMRLKKLHVHSTQAAKRMLQHMHTLLRQTEAK